MKYFLLSVFILIDCLIVKAQAAEQSAFVGKYKKSDHESLSELYILNDKTYCYVFMGGSLDLIRSGSWEVSNKHKNAIVLSDKNIDSSSHLARGQKFNRLDNKISISINGYSLHDVNTPVFAFSKSNTPPSKFRTLLPKNNNVGRASYSFPLISPDDAKYIYLGSIVDSDKNSTQQLQITQYKIGSNDVLQLGFDNQQNMLPQTMYAQLIDGKLNLNGESIGTKSKLKQRMIDEVKEHCIKANDQEENSEWTILKPSDTFYEEQSVIIDKPYFNENDSEEAKRENDISALIKDEKQLLEIHYQNAQQDLKSFNEFLSISKNLLLRKKRKNIYIEDINMKLSQLLVNTNQFGKVDSAIEQFNAYALDIYPLIKDSTNKQVQYSILVMASQGAVIYGITRDETILTTIFNTLLSENFDIKTTNNPTLAYNLACIYALTKNKPEMIKAITAARKMKKPTEQFMKDGDFAFYLTDNDFLAAINTGSTEL